MAELITNDSIVYVASKNDHANNNTNSNKNDPNATTVGDDNNDSDSEDEYLLLDIYDEEILKYSNPLDGLAIIVCFLFQFCLTKSSIISLTVTYT